jgi:hypothetical protein
MCFISYELMLVILDNINNGIKHTIIFDCRPKTLLFFMVVPLPL